MKRWHQEFPRTRREWSKAIRWWLETRSTLPDTVRKTLFEKSPDDQPGRYRKRRAFDCGNTRCGLCHREKYPRRQPTLAERASQLTLREGLAEIQEQNGSRADIRDSSPVEQNASHSQDSAIGSPA